MCYLVRRIGRWVAFWTLMQYPQTRSGRRIAVNHSVKCIKRCWLGLVSASQMLNHKQHALRRIQKNWNTVSQICWQFVIYCKRSIQQTGNKHLNSLGYLTGCIVPTGALPEKKVFITGYTTDSDNMRALFGKSHLKVYLSQSPSLQTTCKMGICYWTKTKRDEQRWLGHALCYEFGTIIFPW